MTSDLLITKNAFQFMLNIAKALTGGTPFRPAGPPYRISLKGFASSALDNVDRPINTFPGPLL